MRVFRGLPPPAQRSACALTIGNFDGVHRGHQALLAAVREAADRLGVRACVMTFEPHPREFLTPASAPARLATLRDKIESLRRHGVDQLVVMHFNQRFSELTAEAFIERKLVDGLHARWLMIGDDFCFGARRAGNFQVLSEAGQRHGFEVVRMPTVSDEGLRISSSAVRDALAAGDLDRAAVLLGHRYTLSGHVVHGQKLGRQLGFPTLNLRVAHGRPAMTGIFVVRVHGLDDVPVSGVASLGRRPTVDDSGRVLLEVHCFDFQRTVYGKLVQVEFLHKLRDEASYDGLEALTRQIARDAAQARDWFMQAGTKAPPATATGSDPGIGSATHTPSPDIAAPNATIPTDTPSTTSTVPGPSSGRSST